MKWCKVIGHTWKHYDENHLFKGDTLLDGKVYPIPLRECKRCKIRHHHLMPMINGGQYHWKQFLHKPGAVINLVSLGSVNIHI